MNIQLLIAGGIILCSAALGLFFFRFWQKSKDPLFACFSLSFVLLGIERVLIVQWLSEVRPAVYLIRLSAFLLIVFAVIQKNRRGR